MLHRNGAMTGKVGARLLYAVHFLIVKVIFVSSQEAAKRQENTLTRRAHLSRRWQGRAKLAQLLYQRNRGADERRVRMVATIIIDITRERRRIQHLIG